MCITESMLFDEEMYWLSRLSIGGYMYKKPVYHNEPTDTRQSLLPIPHSRDFRMPHLLLKLEDAVHQRFAGRRTAWNVDVHGHYSVATSSHRVAVVIISTAVCAATHANHPSWIRHLVVHLPQCRRHFVCECSRHNHHVRLAR